MSRNQSQYERNVFSQKYFLKRFVIFSKKRAHPFWKPFTTGICDLGDPRAMYSETPYTVIVTTRERLR